MKKLFILAFAVWCVACSSEESSSSTSITYKIDDAMSNEISRQLTDNIPADSINVRLIVDDSVTFSTYETPRRLSVVTSAILHKDTIHIDGFVGTKAGFGFSLDVFKDGMNVNHIVKSGGAIYKLKNDDTQLRQILEVPCTRAEVVLAKKPRFKAGEIVSGKVQLSSEEYYEKIGGRQKKYRIQLTCYFRTDPVIEDK